MILIIQIILMVLLAMFSSWEEIQQLIQRSSWKKKDYRIPIWGTDWKGFKRLFNSHHVAFGLFVLTMFTFVYFVDISVWWLIPVYWIVFFWLRNIYLHIIFKRKPSPKYLYEIWS